MRPASHMVRAIGIDPGSRYTGYGVVEGDGNRLVHIANGVIRTPSQSSFPERLKTIYEQLTIVIDEGRPASMAVEEVFFAKNVKSALRLGQARGAAILAGVNAGLPVYEYSALEIKQAVVGYGRAGKDQVAQMIQHLFKLREALNTNAADALAVAVCHLNTTSSRARWNIPKPG
jgi:crossover junction endodeoxyribonuclease RuvC